MKGDLSEPSSGQIDADYGEAQSKDMRGVARPTSTSWTNEKHMLYIVSLEESFVKQLYGNQFHLHFKNLIGQPRPIERTSNSSLTIENNPENNKFKSLEQGRWKTLQFEKSRSKVQNPQVNCSGSPALSANQWIRHFKSDSRGKTVISKPSCEEEDNRTSKSIKRRSNYNSKESTYSEVSDQNFTQTQINASSSHKKTRWNTTLNDQVVPSGKLCAGNEPTVI